MALLELQTSHRESGVQKNTLPGSDHSLSFNLGPRPETCRPHRHREDQFSCEKITGESLPSRPSTARIDELECGTLLDSIKTCGAQKDLSNGSRLHAQILKRGYAGHNVYLCTALLHMYAKCGDLSKAQAVFDELPAHDVVSWNALIAGYAQQGFGREALRCFAQMRDEGFHPGPITYVCALKACGSIGASDAGEQIHAEVRRQGLVGKNIVLGTALVDMYARCGSLINAQEVFDELPERNRVTWNVLISGYAQHQLGNEALQSFCKMKENGHSPDAASFVGALKACSSLQATQRGIEIHEEINQQRLLPKNVVLGTALVDMYGKCGALSKAQEVFELLPSRDLPLWNALLSGYSQHGHGKLALEQFHKMKEEGFAPDEVTFVCISKACGSIGAVDDGEALHAEVRRQGLLKKNILLGTAVIDMYAKLGVMAKAQEVFDEIPTHTVASWTALIAGYSQHGKGIEALHCFQRMQDEGHVPNEITFICALKACSSIGAPDKGEELLVEIRRQDLLRKNIVLGNAAVDMFAKCHKLTKAEEVFDELPTHDVSSWNSLITGYVDQGFYYQAIECLDRMQNECIEPDAITLSCILRACGSAQAVQKGGEIHVEIRKQGLLCRHAMLGTALVDMYAKCGLLEKAHEVLRDLPERDVSSWTALIGGYEQHGFGDDALSCFKQMQEEDFAPNAITYVFALKACGSIGAAEKGEMLHAEIRKQHFLEEQYLIGSALVDMYVKCGALSNAQMVFNELQIRDVISWTALLSGYAQFGDAERVLDYFDQMACEGVEPNGVTFSVLLNACSHAGFLAEGYKSFNSMSTSHCITPTIEHFVCIIDLFSRAGQFDQAIRIIEEVQLADTTLLWAALLGACQIWTKTEIGRWAFEHAVLVDGNFSGTYVGMSNLYASSGILKGSE